MGYAYDPPEHVRVVWRYVRRGRRYSELCGGRFLAMQGRERRRFARRLARDAHKITPRSMDILLSRGWRERMVAAWLVAVARRSEFRERLAELLLTPGDYSANNYCLALARLGTPADADILVSYLARSLPRPDLCSHAGTALGALLLLDAEHGVDRTSGFLVPNGPWQRWNEGRPHVPSYSPEECRDHAALECAYAAESATYIRRPDK